MDPTAAVDTVRAHLSELRQVVDAVLEQHAHEIASLARYVTDAIGGGGKVMFCGNGGSAADAQHLATEYVVRFARERRALPAVALTTDTSLLTAGANDYGFETVFARQVEALGRPGDVLILHSTSGNSPNLLEAARVARARDIRTVGVLAKGGGALQREVDLAVVVPTDSTARAQELHLAIGHVVCEIADQLFASSGDAQI